VNSGTILLEYPIRLGFNPRVSLSYRFEFAAPATAKAANLERFLRRAEALAKDLGFSPTLVLNAEFDTPERRQFARRLTGGCYIEAPELKNLPGVSSDDAARYQPETGSCRLVPQRAVVLVVTDERGCETVLGFFQWPGTLRNSLGEPVYSTGLAGRWSFRNFVDSPDPRYRQIVRLFANAGFLASQKDEFHPAPVKP